MGRSLCDCSRWFGISSKRGSPPLPAPDMDAWQKTHVAWVSPLAQAIYMADRKGLALKQPKTILRLTVQAIREAYTVLTKLGIPITPPKLKLWQATPERLLIDGLRLWTKSQHFKTLILRHSLAAKDEMSQIAKDFEMLIRVG